MKFFKRKVKDGLGLSDKISDRREGLLFIQHDSSDDDYRVVDYKSNYNVIYEVKEIYNDKILSKVEIINVPFNRCLRKDAVTNNFNPWIDSTRVHWLSPSTPVDRDNKLNEILK